MPKKQPSIAVAATVSAPEADAEDPSLMKVNDRGGKEKEKYSGRRNTTPGESRAHPRRHDMDITGRYYYL